MVVIQIKNSEQDTFLYETSSSHSGENVVREITQIWNLRLRLALLSQAILDLAKYGPMKLPDKAGIDDIQEKGGDFVIERNEFYCMDPSGIRTGNGVGPRLTETFEQVSRDAQDVLSKV